MPSKQSDASALAPLLDGSTAGELIPELVRHGLQQLIEQEIDWPCQIERLYSDVNQGCRLGVSRAITWFFEQVEEGIILEDDCVPHPDFFPYCATLLEPERGIHPAFVLRWGHGSHHCLPQIPSRDSQAGA